LLLISAFPGALAYVLVDLHHGAMHFLYFVLTIYSCMLVVESLMMMVASIVPDFLLGIIAGAGIQVHTSKPKQLLFRCILALADLRGFLAFAVFMKPMTMRRAHSSQGRVLRN
jgi:hypothetical protein